MSRRDVVGEAGEQLPNEKDKFLEMHKSEHPQNVQMEEQIKDKQEQYDTNDKTKPHSMSTYLAIFQWILLIFCVVSNIYLLTKPPVECECGSNAQTQIISVNHTTNSPTLHPSIRPTIDPTIFPSIRLTPKPTNSPSFDPTVATTRSPSASPSGHPSFEPSQPTAGPSNVPTSNTTRGPSDVPTAIPTINPTTAPSLEPTFIPTSFPSIPPTLLPSSAPSISHGSIVQIQSVISHTKVTVSDESTWIEPSADYRVSITPKYTDSMFLITYNFGWNGYGIDANTVVLWSAARSIGSGSFSREAITSSGTVHSLRHRIAGMAARRNNGFDTNDMNFCNWMTIDYPNTMEEVMYTLYMRQEENAAGFSGSVSIGASFYAQDVVGWTTPVSVVVMEIQNSN
eukprot:758177_1